MILASLSIAGPVSSAEDGHCSADRFPNRPLSRLPWVESDLSTEEVLKEIFREPALQIRYPVMQAFLEQLPVEEWPEVFDLCIELQGLQIPDHLVGVMMESWAMRDPNTAWEKCETLFDIVIEDIPFSDSWQDEIVVINPAAVAKSDFWLSRKGSLRGFINGLKQVGATNELDARLLHEQFKERYEKRFGELPGAAVVPLEQEMEAEFTVVNLLSCPVEKIPDILHERKQSWGRDLFSRALIRWLHLKPKEGLKIASFAKKFFDPQNIIESPDRAFVPHDFMLEWICLDRQGYKKWLSDQQGWQYSEGVGVAKAFLDKKEEREWFGRDGLFDGRSYDLELVMGTWAMHDPERAIPEAWNLGYEGVYGDAAFTSITGVGRSIRPALDVIIDYNIPIPDDPMYMIMEDWGDVDIGEAAAFGVKWLLKTRMFSKEDLIGQWSGKADAWDATMSDRTFGCLRAWAVTRPKEMKKWIESLEDKEVRDALLSLLASPHGGEKK